MDIFEKLRNKMNFKETYIVTEIDQLYHFVEKVKTN